jgi:ABC-type nitrate/sulfonate/bicarbonate transport system substrate-binding protein
MRKILTALVAAAAIAASAVATPATAQSWYGAGYYPYPTGYYGYALGPYPGRACVWQQVWNGWAWVRGCV